MITNTPMQDVTIEFTIPLPPISKKNSQQIIKLHNRPCIIQSKQYRQYEKDAAPFIPKLPAPIKFPVNVEAVFYVSARRKCDLTNYLEAADDVMVKCGLLEDDNCMIICAHDGSRVVWDKDKPRTEISITPYIGATPWEE
jgi:Holliday junction resolvase RusA-like endonuclease